MVVSYFRFRLWKALEGYQNALFLHEQGKIRVPDAKVWEWRFCIELYSDLLEMEDDE